MSQIANGTIKIDADVSSAISNLDKVSSRMSNLVPGASAVNNVLGRVSSGFYQLIQGVSRDIFREVTQSASNFVSKGVELAGTIESSAVAFENLLGSAEDAKKLLLDIQKNAIKTPFDVEYLTTSTQKLALITQNGALAEQTVLDLGAALAAAGRGSAELTRMATNMQQIGTNAFISARDIREFGNAGIDILGLVSDYLRETGKVVDMEKGKAEEYLKSISDPYTVIANALHYANSEGGRFAGIYEKGATTIRQVTENMSDALSVFSYRLMNSTGIVQTSKDVFSSFIDLFTDDTFTANSIAAVQKLVDSLSELNIIQPVIEGIRKAISAFASGQFDNVIVFFKTLFNTIKQFSGLKIITNTLKVFLDLFSDNHTAEEVRKVAEQIGNFIRNLLELKMVLKIAGYLTNVLETFYMFGQGVLTLGSSIISAVSSFSNILGTLGAMRGATMAVVLAVTALITVMSALGSSSANDFLNNIYSGFKNLVGFLGDLVGNFVNIGYNLIAGLWNGIADALSSVFGKIRDAANQIVNAFKTAFGIHSPSRRMKDEIGQYIDLGIAEGIRSYYPAIESAADEVLEKLVQLQDKYVTELRQFGALDLVQQVNVYRDFTELYKKGTRARLEMDEKVHDAETAITKEIIDLVEEYNKAFDKSMHAAKDYYDMFEYTQAVLTRTSASVIEGLTRQNDNMTQYYQNLLAISKMGFDPDFMQYIYDQGMDAATEVAGLASATQEQIDKINELWKTRGQVATDIAVLNTKKLKDETLDEVSYLQSGLKEEVVKVYDTGTLLGYNFTEGIYRSLPTLEDAMAEVASSARKGKADVAKAASGLTDFDAALGDIEDLQTDLQRLDIQAFDTADAFSLLKNIMGGIPWQLWAGAIVITAARFASFVKKAKETKAVNDAIINIGKATSKAGDMVGEAGNAINETFKQNEKVAAETGNGISKAAKEWSNNTIKEANISHAQTLNSLRNSTETIQAFFQSVRSVVSSAFENIFGTIVDIINGFARQLMNGITTLFDDLLASARSMFRSLVNVASGMVQDFARAFRQTVPSIQNILTDIVKIITTTIDRLATGLAKIVKSLGKVLKSIMSVVGESIAALLKKLGDPKAISGAATLALLAGSMLMVAEAAKIMEENVTIVGVFTLVTLTAALAGISVVLSQLSGLAPTVLAGAVTIAAAGAGLAAAALALGLASDAVNNINTGNLLLLTVDLTIASVAMGILSLFTSWVALGAVAAAAIGGGLAVAALALGLASDAVNSINYGNLFLLSLDIAIAGVMLSVLGAFISFVAVGAIAAAAIGGGLAVAAVFLKVAADNAAQINYGALVALGATVAIASVVLGLISGFAVFGAIATIASTVLAGGLVTTAILLAVASEQATKINLNALYMLEGAVAQVSLIMAAVSLAATLGAVGAGMTSLIAINLLIITNSLVEASNKATGINVSGFDVIQQAIHKLVEIDWGNVFGNFFNAMSSGMVAGIADNVREIVDTFIEISNLMAQLEPVKDKLDGYIDTIYDIVDAFVYLDFGNAVDAFFQKNASGSIREIANNVDEIISAIASIVQKLQDIDNSIADESTVNGYVNRAVDLVKIIAEFGGMSTEGSSFFGSAYSGLKGCVNDLKDVANSVSEIISSIKNIVDKMQEVERISLDETERYIRDAVKIIRVIAEFKDENGESISTSGGWFSTAYSGLKDSINNLKEIAGGVSDIVSNIKNIVDILKGLQDAGIDESQVQSYITTANSLVKKFAELKVEGDDLNKTSENVGFLSTMSENVSKFLEHAKKVVENITYFTETNKTAFDRIIDESENGYITKINKMLAAFGKLAAASETENAYQNLAGNISDLATAVDSVSKILETAVRLVEAVKAFDAAYPDEQAIINMVNKINNIIKAIAVDPSIHIDGNKVEESDVTALANVAKALDYIKTIAEKANAVPELANQATRVKDVVEFIKKTLSELPGTFRTFTADYTAIGAEYANAFIEGWKSKLGDGTNAGRDMAQKVIEGISNKHADIRNAGVQVQGKFWEGLESKIPDEIGQGKELASKVIDGINAKRGDFEMAGKNATLGFSTGLNSNVWMINRAMGNISSAAVNTLKQLLDIHSPSKVMAGLGTFVAQGLAEGIEDGLADVEQAGEAMAEALLDGYNGAMEPLTASADIMNDWNESEKASAYGPSSAGRSVTINQTNNIYDNMDMSKALGDITWQVSRA